MKKATVQDTVTEYLEQFNRRGFLYVPSQPWDSRKIRAMQKKAIEILSFQDNPGVLAETVHIRGEADSIRDSIRDTISKMQRKSNEEYLIANDYFAFLNQKYKLQIQPFDRQLTSLERQLSIAKDMHDFNKARDFDRQEVAEKYLVSEKTIENDMKALREGISVMDQEIRLSDVQLRNRKVTAISTMHPLFLAQNLTQIICMLEGLRRMEDDWALQSYARNTAVSIWCQLSDYARERISGTLVDLMGLDANWYERISCEAEMRSGKMFYNEKESSDRFGLLMYAMKGGIPCCIRYIDNDKACEVRGTIKELHGNTIRVSQVPENEELRIDKKQILEIEVATQLR